MTQSWLLSAQAENSDFPIENLPYGVFQTNGKGARCGIAIGDLILDLAAAARLNLLGDRFHESLFAQDRLNPFMAEGQKSWSGLRTRIQALLTRGSDDALSSRADLQDQVLVRQADARMLLPFEVTGYTDFFASRQHAFNSGSILRTPDTAILPNWFHLPVAYNGRASTVIVSGEDVPRPLGQFRTNEQEFPQFGPCRRLDLEVEFGAVVGMPNSGGLPLTTAEAYEHIFGFVLLNDWSARDIQAWEGQPLGPFQAKAFRTSISPWVVTKEALEPFRRGTPPREFPLLPYLHEAADYLYDVELEAWLRPEGAAAATRITATNYSYMYYSAPQLLAHHAIGGCRMRTGDLLGSGTVSGSSPEQFGCLMERTWAGQKPLTLDSGETRTFLEDGDTVTLRGHAQGPNYRIGFGECRARIVPSPAPRDWTAPASI